MLGIFAQSFMNATRVGETPMRDARQAEAQKRRWLPVGHWWLDTPRLIDVNRL